MFEDALIRHAGVDKVVDIGQVAEALFFYGSTQLLLDRSSVIALATKIPGDTLRDLIDRESIKLSYLQDAFGVISTGTSPFRVHTYGAFQFGGNKTKRIGNYREEIEEALERTLGRSRDTRKLVKAIASNARLHKFGGPNGTNPIPNLANADAKDPIFLSQAIRVTLKALVPSYDPGAEIEFSLFDTGSGFSILTNLNFTEINKVYHQHVPPSHSTIDAPLLLSHLQNARADTYFASEYMAEIVTSPLNSDLIRLKHYDFLRRRVRTEDELKLFHEVILPEFPSLREAINSNERSIVEFIDLLDKSEKFKSWIRQQNPDASLLENYYKAVTADTWADKLPSKAVRFAIASGVGLAAEAIHPSGISTAIGVGLGGTDSLLLDKIIRGWRPSHFIQGAYREFLSDAS